MKIARLHQINPACLVSIRIMTNSGNHTKKPQKSAFYEVWIVGAPKLNLSAHCLRSALCQIRNEHSRILVFKELVNYLFIRFVPKTRDKRGKKMSRLEKDDDFSDEN